MKRNIFAFCLSLILLCGCDLDYTNTGAISPPDFITFLRHHIAHNDNQRVT